MRRIFCVLLAVLICASLVAPAFATDDFVDSVENTDPTSESTDPTIDGGDSGDDDGVDDNEKPDTGDNGNVMLWGGMMALSMVALAVLVTTRRKTAK